MHSRICNAASTLVERYCAAVELYSVDECFLLVNEKRIDLSDLGHDIRNAARRNIGLSVSNGVCKG